MADEEKKKKEPKTIFGYSPEELQQMLAEFAKKIPFLRQAATGVEKSRKRIEGKEGY